MCHLAGMHTYLVVGVQRGSLGPQDLGKPSGIGWSCGEFRIWQILLSG
jgi:hypothetical protein